MKQVKTFEDVISAWSRISVHPHRFGGMEFQFGDAEVGHVHRNGIVDIPFPRSIRDALLADSLAEEHHWVPNSGWITFQMRTEEDLGHALWLMGLSYLRYALKTASDPRWMLEHESNILHLSPQFRSLLEKFVPRTGNLAAIGHSRHRPIFKEVRNGKHYFYERPERQARPQPERHGR